jgi:hypothetical protein
MWNAQGDPARDARRVEAQKKVDQCDSRLARYREALEAGTDPKTVAGWIADVQARKAEALSALASVHDRRPLSVTEIRDLVASVGGMAGALAKATAEEKRDLYQALGLSLTYQPANTAVRAEVNLDQQAVGLKVVSGGGLEPPRPVKGTSTSS